MGAWDETCYVEKFDGYGATALGAGAVVGFATVRDVVASAGAVDLEVAYGPLGVDGCEAVGVRCRRRKGVMRCGGTYGKLPVRKPGWLAIVRD